jgi:hypothetical protein
VTKPKEVEKPWNIYRKPDGRIDKLYQPGWAGALDDEEVERLQQALSTDPDLARVWGWRPSMRRRAVSAIERVAAYGSPDDIALNRKLVREFSRRPKADNESSSPRVKKEVNPSPPQWDGRRLKGGNPRWCGWLVLAWASTRSPRL